MVLSFCKHGKAIVPVDPSPAHQSLFSNKKLDLKQLINEIENKETKYEDPDCGEIIEFDIDS